MTAARILFSILLLAAGGAGLAQPLKVQEVFEVGPNVYVRALTVEPKRNALWVGTSSGVHEVDLKTNQVRQTFTRKDGLANEYVFAVGVDREGYKWFGTNAGGASRYRDGKWKTFFPMHGLADYWIYSFASQKDGTFWIGTWAGVNRYDPKTGKFHDLREGTGQRVGLRHLGRRARPRLVRHRRRRVDVRRTRVALLDAQGRAGCAQPRQPAAEREHRARHALAPRPVGLGGRPTATYNPNYVFSILAARDGGVWAGTWGGGAARFDGKTWTNLTTRDGLAGNIVYSIAEQDRRRPVVRHRPAACRATTARRGPVSASATGCSRTTSTRSPLRPMATCGQGRGAAWCASAAVTNDGNLMKNSQRALLIAAAVHGGGRCARRRLPAWATVGDCAGGGRHPGACRRRRAQHPPLPFRARPARSRRAKGKVEVDKARSFTHFRVGKKNVKRIHVDGDVVWVGTSGGVIRYDNRTDEFKLFDVKSGLLSNGSVPRRQAGRPHRARHLRRRHVAARPGQARRWETYNIPDGLGDAFVYDVLRRRTATSGSRPGRASTGCARAT